MHKFCYCATFAAVEVSGEKAIVSVQGRERDKCTEIQKSVSERWEIPKFP